MPSLTFQVPLSEWAVLEEHARREGVSVRTLVLWKLKGEFGLLPKRPAPPVESEPQVA